MDARCFHILSEQVKQTPFSFSLGGPGLDSWVSWLQNNPSLLWRACGKDFSFKAKRFLQSTASELK